MIIYQRDRVTNEKYRFGVLWCLMILQQTHWLLFTSARIRALFAVRNGRNFDVISSKYQRLTHAAAPRSLSPAFYARKKRASKWFTICFLVFCIRDTSASTSTLLRRRAFASVHSHTQIYPTLAHSPPPSCHLHPDSLLFIFRDLFFSPVARYLSYSLFPREKYIGTRMRFMKLKSETRAGIYGLSVISSR